MTSYLCKIDAENLQNGDYHLAQTPDFGISGTIWRIEVSEFSFLHFFGIFAFELKLFFEWGLPLKAKFTTYSHKMLHKGR